MLGFSYPFDECIDERRLADARLSGHKDDLSIAAKRPRQPALHSHEFGFASDGGTGFRNRCVLQGWTGGNHRRDESIPATVRSLDEARRCRIIA